MDPDKIQGDVQRPYQQEPDRPEADPNKFKKVMKVEDTDEAQKRNKRNLKREEEEGEDEDVEEKAPPQPSNTTAFSEFMSDKDDLDNMMDPESGGVRYQAQPEDESMVAPEPGSINTEGVEVDDDDVSTSQPQGQTEQEPSSSGQPTPQPPAEEPAPPSEESFSSPMYEGDFQEEPYQQEPLEQKQPQEEQQYSTESSQQESTSSTQQPQESGKKEQGDEKSSEGKKSEDESLLASQPKMSDILPKKKKTKKPPTPEVRTLPKEIQPSQETGKETGVQISKTKEKEGVPQPETQVGKKEGAPQAPFEEVEGVEKGGEATGTVPKGAPFEKNEGIEKRGETTGAISKGATTAGAPHGEELPEGVEEGAPSRQAQGKEETPFRRLTPQEVRNQRLGKEGEATTAAIEGIVVPSLGEGQKGEMGKEKHKDEKDDVFIEATADTASITLPLFDTPVAPVTPSEETPSYTKLTPDVHELFEKMGGVMLVQMDKGITTTTMDINLPNSVFNGAQVILEQYDSAPHSYNLQLVGSPEAVKAFTQHLDSLDKAFQDARFNFEVNILNPSISQTKKSPHLIRRKGAAGDKGGSKQQK